jgi:hypothetical protein
MDIDKNIAKDHAGHLRDEIHGTNQCMKNQHKFVKDEYNYDNLDFYNNSNTQTFTHDCFE